ncbi:ABC transporter permease [Labrys wisconsinensis]|uniref:Xylose transport system permease protein XylH n=1 Tax=Labrys wisconsinensis TaxID=425677 RepID=A0ABU0JDP8_9HYPH|nr:ABC transporter permease [Labrys wisconsinensis]MDQ0471523.1 ribose transport system permease protein [Labrys wisconsinensis]
MLASLKRVDPGRYVIYLGFLAIFAVFLVVLRDDGFASPGNLFNIVQQTAPVTVMAVGMVFVLTAGEIDLSIGSVVAISALLAAVVLRDWPWPAGVAVGLGAGAAIGALNGALVAYARLPSFLVTLATMGILAGVARRLTNLQSVPITNDVYNGLFGSGTLFGIPSLILWTVAAVAVGAFVFRETRFGAHVHAVGDSARAARATGIKVLRLRFSVLVLSGMLAALAGLLYAGRLHGARYTLGEADLLTVIAAVIVGGTRLNGGAGSILGALIGSLLMGVLNNGLILMGYQPSDQMIARGLIILVAVALTLREPDR